MFPYLQNLTMYRLMLYYLRTLIAAAVVLSFFGILPFVWWHILLQALYLPIACGAFNWIIAKLFKVQTNYESQFITGNILTLIIGPFNPLANLPFLTIAAFTAMASKYLLAYKKRHVFNPAAFAVLFTALFLNEGASWWVGNVYLLPIMLIGGFLILQKLRWFHLFWSFLLIFSINTFIPIATNVYTVASMLSPILFFATVMLIEPLTTPVGKRTRIFYGVAIALILYLFQNYTSLPYTLELTLLIGNLGFRLIKPKENTVLKFVEKRVAAKNIFEFWFSAEGARLPGRQGSASGGEPIKKFQFAPGQFLEWWLPHSKPDSRGIRRWFTIASSPTEERVLLATKIFEQPSSFKQALNNLQPGEEITVIPPDGDFVLPKDPGRKLAFIAGGIGITPFRSIIKFLLDINQSRDIVLLYSAKTAGEFVFQDLSDEAKKIGLRPVYIATDDKGYINPEMIKQEVPDWQERLFYVSGPEPMVEAFEKMLYSMGIKKENVKRDYFPGYKETYA